jgi:hypothetical protein
MHLERVDTRRLPRATVLAGATAAIANLIVYWLGVTLFAVPFLIPMPGLPDFALMHLPISNIVILSTVPALGAAVVLWLLGRFTQRPFRLFGTIGLVVLILSFGSPLALATDQATKLWLEFMHVVAAAAILTVLITGTRVTDS